MTKSFDESAQAVHSMLSANATGPSVLEEPEEEEDDRSDASSVRNMSPSSSSDEADEAETRQDEGSSDDEVKLSPAKRPGMSEEEEADFARDLAKMMSGTGTNKSLNARANLDVGLPMLKRDGASIAADENHMTFNLLTKKGAKAQVSNNVLFVLEGRSADSI